MSKKFEELRPFDLEAAKAGAPICYMDGDIPSSWFIHDDVLYVEWSNEPERFVQFKADTGLDRWCMAPLCWVEDRPVYKGDVLWNKLYPEYRYDVARFENGIIYSLQNETYSHCEDVENLTWVGPHLCMVEGKPLCASDTLWLDWSGGPSPVRAVARDDYGIVIQHLDERLEYLGQCCEAIEHLSWTKPKKTVKKEGWIAVKTGEKPVSYAAWCSYVYETKEQAEAHYGAQTACIRIEWEEEA